MIGYITLGVNDLAKSKAFYLELLANYGVSTPIEMDRIIFMKAESGDTMLALCKPWDGNPCSNGNGSMVSFNAGDRANVDAMYQKALELGATDEGAPGERLPVFYGAYVRDPDGNKLCFYELKLG